MKKIVVLGGAEFQLPLIIAAKSLGYYVIIIDFRKDVVGKQYGDVYYQADATDYAVVLDICNQENIDGIVSNSEYTVSVANRVATELSLNGNSVECIEKLQSKALFRKVQSDINVFSPKSIEVSTLQQCLTQSQNLRYPIIIKPSESSGTRGTTKVVLFDKLLISKCFHECQSFSRNNLVTIEEYIEMPSLTTVEGDVFIYNGHILWNGLYNTTRSFHAPMIPMTYSAPLVIGQEKETIIKETISKIFASAEVRFGQFNIEGYFTSSGDFFVIEINARQGGNGLSFFLEKFTTIDYNKLLVSTAVDDKTYWNDICNMSLPKKYVLQHSAYSYKDGILTGIKISDQIRPYVTRINKVLEVGDPVIGCKDASNLVAIINVEFNDIETYLSYYRCLDRHITVLVD